MKPTLLQQKARPKKPLWREYGEALLVALVLALVIRTFVVQAFKIPSESMLQTLLVGDHLLASKFAYGIKIPFTDTYVYKGDDPARGDIIIFKYPNDPSVDYIKRIIGVPGDVIEVRNRQLYRNGQPARILASALRILTAEPFGTITADPPCRPTNTFVIRATTRTIRWTHVSGVVDQRHPGQGLAIYCLGLDDIHGDDWWQ